MRWTQIELLGFHYWLQNFSYNIVELFAVNSCPCLEVYINSLGRAFLIANIYGPYEGKHIFWDKICNPQCFKVIFYYWVGISISLLAVRKFGDIMLGKIILLGIFWKKSKRQIRLMLNHVGSHWISETIMLIMRG